MDRNNQLTAYISAKRPIIYINHYDYNEIDNFIEKATEHIIDKSIYEYRAIGEMNFRKNTRKNSWGEQGIDLFSFLKVNCYKTGKVKNIFLVLKDIDEELKDTRVTALIRKISEMTMYNKNYNCTIIIVSQNRKVPKELESYITVVELPTLSETELKNYILEVAEQRKINVDEKDLGELSILLKGLSKWNITQILNMLNSISNAGENIQKIIIEKGLIIKKSGILELINFKEEKRDIGGLENLMEWLDNKAEIFRHLDEAKKFGIKTPKGLLLVGMPGCGKSLTAKAASRMFNVPLLRLDIGRLLGKYVGESEENLRTALKMSEAVSPCILWIDEVEKAFAGIDQTGGASDITKRLFGQFLTWLQEKENTVFVVATANNISSIPLEFLRKGRFDEIFYLDFPTKEEREEIFKIHLKKAGKYNRDTVDLEKIAEETKGFSGADIEETVKITLERIFLNKYKDENVYTSDLQESIKSIDSITSIFGDKIKQMREDYTKYKLRPASLKEGEKKVEKDAKENIRSKEPDMIFVRGGKYISNFYSSYRGDVEKEICDLFVNKYLVTQDIWKKIMGNYPSYFREDKRPVERITWRDAMEFCNRLSIQKGLKPVYQIGATCSDNKVEYLNGEVVNTEKADFSKTEGYRLPTIEEWEWFAWGGEIAIQNGTFNKKNYDEEEVEKYAWFGGGGIVDRTQEVGKKKANELGLYDVVGNVWEMTSRRKEGWGALWIVGGSWQDWFDSYEVANLYTGIKAFGDTDRSYTVGFRIVRTAAPPKELVQRKK